MNSDAPAPRAKVCVLFPGALGDFLCFLPALQSIAQSADVEVYAQSDFADLVPSRVTVHSLERAPVRELFTSDPEALEQAKSFFAGYAAIYSWLGSREPEFTDRLRAASLGKAQIFPFRPQAARLHQIDHYLKCLKRSGPILPEPAIELRADALSWRDEFWTKHMPGRCPVLVLGAGSGASEKNWPEKYFIVIAEWWRSATGGAVVLPVGPVEEERGGIECLRSCCVTATGLRLSQLAALIAGSDLYLGNDSGVSHLAATLGRRTVVLFGPSDSEQWAPRGDRVTVVRHDLQCSPCELQNMKRCLHRSCLTALHPGEVIEILMGLPEVLTLTRLEAGITV